MMKDKDLEMLRMTEFMTTLLWRLDLLNKLNNREAFEFPGKFFQAMYDKTAKKT